MSIESNFPPIPPPPPINAHTFFFNQPGAVEPPDYVIHIDVVTGQERMRSEFVELVNDAATVFAASGTVGGLGLGAGSNEMVGLFADNSMDYVVLVHALLKIAQPFACISSHCTPYELAHCLKRTKVTTLFTAPELLAKAMKVSGSAAPSRVCILGKHVAGRPSFSSLIRHRKKRNLTPVETQPVNIDTLAYLVFSSGTSGLPKAVMISHGALIYSQIQYVKLMEETLPFLPTPPEGFIHKTLAMLPMFHSFGLHVYCFRALLAPSTMVIMPRWDVDLAIECIPKYKITGIALIPSIIHTLVNSKKFMDPKVDMSSLLSAGSGAAYLPPSLAEKFKERTSLQSLGSGYGLSEVTIAGLIVPIDGMCGGRVRLSPGTTGVLMPGQKARIVLDDGHLAKVGEIGELWLAGANLALGYYGDEKATRETFVTVDGDRWLRTGDRFRVDENQNFFFEDRAKDTLKVSGMQVSPKELEEFILQGPDTKALIGDVAVAGVTTKASSRTEDEKVPRAWIVLSEEGKKQGAKKVQEKVKAAVESGLSKYKWLRGGVEVIQAIPKNPTGKMLKRELVSAYEKKHPVKAKL